jgi:phosphate transport system protein
LGNRKEGENMSVHLNREIDQLKKELLTLCAMVEERVQMAIKSVENHDSPLAEKVIQGDHEIDLKEIDVEEECLKILALYQPVAVDLRFIIASLKINNDLERIGDLAVNIAERAVYLAAQEKISGFLDFTEMVNKTRTMLKNSLDSLINMDAQLAYSVLNADNEVDEINRQMFELIEKGILETPDKAKGLLHLISVSRHLERIADHTTNIAEDVIYLCTGKIVRHGKNN